MSTYDGSERTEVVQVIPIVGPRINIPHFDLPFRFGTNLHAQVVEQDRERDIDNCVEAIVRTRRGDRLYVPEFGIDDPTFESPTVDLSRISQQIADSETRATTRLTRFVSELVQKIRVEIDRG